MGYISDTARNRTHNLFRPKQESIPLSHSDSYVEWRPLYEMGAKILGEIGKMLGQGPGVLNLIKIYEQILFTGIEQRPMSAHNDLCIGINPENEWKFGEMVFGD